MPDDRACFPDALRSMDVPHEVFVQSRVTLPLRNVCIGNSGLRFLATYAAAEDDGFRTLNEIK